MKRLNQLSIFLENKIGSLYEVMDILSESGIRILASTISDTTEFGILRMVTDDNSRAYEMLRAAGKSCNQSEVVAMLCDSSANTFYNELHKIATQGIVIEYMYCFSIKDRAVMVMRVNDPEKALEVAQSNGIKTLNCDDFAQL